MGAAVASLLLDAVSTAQSFVSVFYLVYTILIFAYVLTTWIRLPYSLQPIQRFLNDVCLPYLRLFRRWAQFGPIDLSPLIGLLVLYGLERIVNDVVLDRLH
jgi:uncharacterized protein YggT (Ycf19 family)